MNSRVVYSVMFFILLLTLLYMCKSSIMFEKNGKMKPFGLNSEQTLFSFGIFTIVLAIASFYLFCIIDLLFGNSGRSNSFPCTPNPNVLRDTPPQLYTPHTPIMLNYAYDSSLKNNAR